MPYTMPFLDLADNASTLAVADATEPGGVDQAGG